MKILGISAGFHDAAAAVISTGGVIKFAAHSERYSRVKNDPWLNHDLIGEALEHGRPDTIVLHESHRLKQLRNLRHANWSALREPSQREWIRKFYPELRGIPIKERLHHESHAMAGVMTSGYSEATVVVIDAIGEFNTGTIWHWRDSKLTRKHQVNFPNSLGVFYSAVTQYVDLKPMEDEYILMGMAAYGHPTGSQELAKQLKRRFFREQDITKHPQRALNTVNLQRGIRDLDMNGYTEFDLARAAQIVVEERIYAYCEYAKKLTGCDRLVYQGGVALNCVANTLLQDIYSDIWIMPNPGDAGSALGAAAAEYNDRLSRDYQLIWCGPYLGTEIPGAYPVERALESLRQGEIFGIANGRAEYGPRALGNRSLLADPRGGDIKDRVNAIKRRQEFRPFAPVILEEHVHEYFDVPPGTQIPYMQYTPRCLTPRQTPAIVHADGTSRVQTVNRDQHPDLYELLTRWHSESGCPMLLNTSLNIKGQPIVNTVTDAQEFAAHYGVKVHTHD